MSMSSYVSCFFHYKHVHWHSDVFLWLMHVLVSMSRSVTSQDRSPVPGSERLDLGSLPLEDIDSLQFPEGCLLISYSGSIGYPLNIFIMQYLTYTKECSNITK